MNDNDAERRRFGQRHVEQALQFGPSLIHTARAGLNKFNCDFPAARRAVGKRLPPLIWNGKIGFRLPPGRDAQIKGGAQCRIVCFAFEGGSHSAISAPPFLAQDIAALPSRRAMPPRCFAHFSYLTPEWR